MKINFSLRVCWTLILILAIMVPSMILMIWFGTQIYTTQLENALQVEQKSNENKRDQIQAEIQRLITIFEHRSGELVPHVQNIDDPNALNKINQLLNNIIKKQSAIQEIVIFSKKGDLIAAIDPNVNLILENETQEQDRKILRSHWNFTNTQNPLEFTIPLAGRVYISSPKEHDGFMAFNISIPIGSPIEGVAVFVIEIERLWLENDDPDQDSEFTHDYMLDRRGSLLTEVNDSPYKVGTLLTRFPITRAGLASASWDSHHTYQGINDQRVFGTVTTIPKLNWLLISEVIEGKIINVIWEDLINIFLLVSLGLVVFMYAIFNLVNKTLLPIQELREAADKVTKGNFQIALQPSGILELDVLSSQFNKMAKERMKVLKKITSTNKALQKSEKQLSALFDSISMGTITIGEDGIIQMFNPAAEHIFGYSIDEIMGENISILLCPSEDNQSENPIEYFLKRNKINDDKNSKFKASTHHLIGRNKDGNKIPLEMDIAQIEINHKKGKVCSFRDLSEVQELEGKLHQLQKIEAVGQLTGGVAHDFNNLLAIIHGNLSLLKMKLALPEGCPKEKAQRYVEEGLKASERGTSLTSRLLAFSRQQVLSPEVLFLDKVVDGMDGMLNRTLGDDVTIVWDLKAGDWLVNVDSSQLENALLNLSINARDAMKDGGTLKISTSQKIMDEEFLKSHLGSILGEYVKLSVSDTGAGMNKKILGKVFDPFFTTKDVGKGTGLGLSMVYGFVKQSGGYITIESELNEGTTLCLYLPRSTNKFFEMPKIDETLATNLRGNETILVVEDEESVRNVTLEMLEPLGYTILEAEDGIEAMDVLKKNKTIDLIISDIMLPNGMKGTEVVKNAKKLKPNLKSLLMSGYTDGALSEYKTNILNKNFINKPFSPKDMAILVRSILDAAL